jgi:diamine N-acetyltransferase
MTIDGERPIEIRAAVTGDDGVLAALCALVQEMHFRERPDDYKPVDIRALEQWFRDVVVGGTGRIWIAEVGTTPAGYAFVTDQRRSENVFCYARQWREVEQLGVHPQFRQHGVARALLDHVARTAAADGVAEVELNTWAFNEDARRAFQRCGFRYKNVRMERPLRPST